MKGIILAGGSGTRLYPITKSLSKHLIPIYDKPMIYYPLSVLMLSGIREVLIITTPDHLELYKKILGSGNTLGMKISYEIQNKPRGLPDAFIVGENFIASDKVALILGDNLFYGQGFTPVLNKASSLQKGALIFGYYVNNPKEFGVVEFDEEGNVISLEEKPDKPKSNYAVPGLYFFDEEVVDLAKKLKPSSRGELEIIDLLKEYLKKGTLKIELLGRGFAWLDTGTCDGLLEASNFVRTIQKRQGLFIACIEEIALKKGFIDKEKLKALTDNIMDTEYGRYIKMISNEE